MQLSVTCSCVKLEWVCKLYLNLLGCFTMSTDNVIEKAPQPVVRGQNVARNTVLCPPPPEAFEMKKVFFPFPGNAERKHKSSIENL